MKLTDKRKELSKIFVKWSLPTRQVAINEILQWREKHSRDTIEQVEGCKSLLSCYRCGEHKKLDRKITRLLDKLKETI